MKASFVTGPLRDRLKVAMASKPVLAAVAYVSNAKDLPLGRGDLLVCDASPAVAEAGSTVRKTLRKLVKDGVAVWSLQDLHAKVVICGKRLIVGSANWSETAEKRKIEAGIDTDDAAVVAAATTFVRGLLENKNALKVDKVFLSTMPDPTPKAGGGPPADMEVEPRQWLISAWPLKETEKNRKAEEELQTKSGIYKVGKGSGASVVWLTCREGFLIAPKVSIGDTVVMTWVEKGQATFVYPPRLVRGTTSATGGFIGLFLLVERGEERRKKDWETFKAAAVQAGLRKNLSTGSSVGLTPDQAETLTPLWKAKRKAKAKA
jgi:hypothetical protein